MTVLLTQLKAAKDMILYGIIIALITYGIVQTIHVGYHHRDIETLRASFKAEQTKVTTQNILIEANKADYEVKLKEASKVTKNITKKYETVYTTIENFKGDTNETTCDTSKRFLDTIKY